MTDSETGPWLDEILTPEDAAKFAQSLAEKSAQNAAFGGFAPELVRGALAKAVTSSLHLDVFATLVEGWRTANEIRAHRVPDPDHPGAVAVVKLGKHSITRELRPVVTIGLGAGLRHPLDVAVALTGTFQGIELSIADGCIQAIGAGTCELSIAFTLGGETLDGPPPKSWKLPGAHRFVPPLPIP